MLWHQRLCRTKCQLVSAGRLLSKLPIYPARQLLLLVATPQILLLLKQKLLLHNLGQQSRSLAQLRLGMSSYWTICIP